MSKTIIAVHKIIIMIASLVCGIIIDDIECKNLSGIELQDQIVNLVFFGIIILIAFIQKESIE